MHHPDHAAAAARLTPQLCVLPWPQLLSTPGQAVAQPVAAAPQPVALGAMGADAAGPGIDEDLQARLDNLRRS